MTNWNWGEILASTQTVLSAAACIGYAVKSDYKHALYWLCAAGITAVVTWGFK